MAEEDSSYQDDENQENVELLAFVPVGQCKSKIDGENECEKLYKN
jgi:hypothetical protein